MSTSFHPQTSRPWDARASDATRPSTPLVGVGVALRALGAALVPGRAAEDVVPALRAADAQALLRGARVLDRGHRTARWDRPTTDAVAAFQRARHLPVTGLADRRTADLLLATAA
ncbi:peptidoglycan-binding domain-containing protein [Patulibacter sp.]|uniref:peptidoglycan-binding domain-containing protein n=1 Tax=Patulibacter sp. TaxID=1912859 RepID=UPI002721A076|nr:peptidoglycan-binding domain-containing protein [Patulibacter sp.]MDO9409250.1 peptidoglycan-binding domain-containing protein [Patulibacter sp.]